MATTPTTALDDRPIDPEFVGLSTWACCSDESARLRAEAMARPGSTLVRGPASRPVARR